MTCVYKHSIFQTFHRTAHFFLYTHWQPIWPIARFIRLFTEFEVFFPRPTKHSSEITSSCKDDLFMYFLPWSVLSREIRRLVFLGIFEKSRKTVQIYWRSLGLWYCGQLATRAGTNRRYLATLINANRRYQTTLAGTDRCYLGTLANSNRR